MRLLRSYLLPCSVERLAGELARPALFRHLASPMLVFDPVEPAETGERWSAREYRFRLLLGGRLPIGEHVINLQRTVQDAETVEANPVVWHDAGYSDLIRVWDHMIMLEDVLGMTRYTDTVEIHAGLLTLPAWLFAKAFYMHRQRRLDRLVAAGFGILIMTEVPDCVDYYPGWVDDADRLFGILQDQLAWEQHAVTLYGRTMPTPRLTAWIGDSAYRYSGIVNEPGQWPDDLSELRERLRHELGVGFNSCLVNLYRDGTDSMGYHSDNEPELGPQPTIASVSLGDRRRFVLRHRTTHAKWSWDLGQGDLLVMRDESQRDYAHAVPKTSRPVGPRMNLTFRRFQTRSLESSP